MCLRSTPKKLRRVADAVITRSPRGEMHQPDSYSRLPSQLAVSLDEKAARGEEVLRVERGFEAAHESEARKRHRLAGGRRHRIKTPDVRFTFELCGAPRESGVCIFRSAQGEDGRGGFSEAMERGGRRSTRLPGGWQESKVDHPTGAREHGMSKRGLIGKCSQVLNKQGKAAWRNCDFENSGFGRSFEKKRDGLAEVVPEVGAFGFVESEELRVFCFGKGRDASEFARSAIAHFRSTFDADAKMPGVCGNFALKRCRRELRRVFLGFEEEFEKLGTDYVDGSGTERRLLDEVAERKSIFGSGKGEDQAPARGGCGKGAEVEAGDDGKSAERADQELVKIVAADVLDNTATALTDATGAIDEFRADEEVPRRAVSMAKRGVHAGGDDASDGGFEIKRDREWQELFLPVERSGEVVEIGSGIDADGEVAGIVMSDLLEARHVQGDVVPRRGHTDSEFRAMAARDQREFFEGGEADDFGNFFCGIRLCDGRRSHFVDDVCGADGRIGGDVRGADGGFETGGEVGDSASHGRGEMGREASCGARARVRWRAGTDANFAAAFAEREDLPGVEQTSGVEGVVDAPHEIEVGVGEKKRHQLGFFHADAVFARERATDCHAIADDFRGGLHGMFELPPVAGIIENNGMKVTVACVENIANVEAVSRTDLADAAKRLRKFGARNHAVEDVVAGSEAAKSAKGVLAAFPEKFAFGVVAGEADFTGMVGVRNFGDSSSLSSDGLSEALDFEEKNRGAVARETGVDEVLDDAECPAIEHFASRGNNGARGNVHNGFGGVVDGIKNREERFDGFGLAGELHGNFGDKRERAFGTYEEAGQVVARSVALAIANPDDFAVRKDQLERGDVIGGDAIGERVGTTGIFGDVAADGAGLLAGWIGRKVQAVRRGGKAKIEIDHARLDDGALILRIDGENAVHARKNDHHAAGAGERSAGKTGAGAAAHDGGTVLCGKFDDMRDLLRGGGKDNDVGAPFLYRAVVLVENDIFRLRKNRGRAEKLLEIAKKARIHSFRLLTGC